jgi:hypothetical protein
MKQWQGEFMDWRALLAKYLPQILAWIEGQATKQMGAPDNSVNNTTVAPGLLVYKLKRKQKRPDGIFSQLSDQNGVVVAQTLEHSYNNLPKLYDGTFKCVRGPHRLNGMTEDFITFEITGVQGHTDILFHWGNYNKDSEGCVLLGQEMTESSMGGMVTSSKNTFAAFMAALEGVNQFMLVVS